MVLIIYISAVFLLIYGVFYYKRYRNIKRLEKLRDNADFTTTDGKALIKTCNRKLDRLRGYSEK